MSKGKFLAVCLIWLTIFGIGAAAWRLLIAPSMAERAEEEAKAEQEAALQQTIGDLPYKHEVTIALDSFSGYAVLRSTRFAQLLRQREIKLNLQDDGADYGQRLKNLQDGKVEMAAFTVDALIKTSADLGKLPATIVAVIDETRGADAMLAYKSVVGSVDDLNDPEMRFVLTLDSPSETLARVVMSNFELDRLPSDPFVQARDAEEVFNRYRQSEKNARQVFVLWEPYVSQMLANENIHVVIDSSRFTGYIVDCFVADRDFLVKQPEVAADVVACYFRALYEFRDPGKMAGLVKSDAGSDSSMDEAMAGRLVEKIAWKNTQENFAHFGIRRNEGVQHLADMIENITKVLERTGAIDQDPTGGQPNRLYYDNLLRELSDDNFHPGTEAEQIASVSQLKPLSESEWETLQPVGTLTVPSLVFARGTDRLDRRSQRILDELIEQLENWPTYYVIVRGNASLRGNLEANKELARQRAAAAKAYLTQHGVAEGRVRAIGGEPSGKTSVSFMLGQLPY